MARLVRRGPSVVAVLAVPVVVAQYGGNGNQVGAVCEPGGREPYAEFDVPGDG